jgi:DNA-binding GntR family transcriptional regulator
LLRRQGADLADFMVIYQLIGPEIAAQIAASPDVAARQRLPDFVEQQWARPAEVTLSTALDNWANLSHEVGHLCESQSLALIAAVLGDLMLKLRPRFEALPPDVSRAFVKHLRDSQRRLVRAIRDGDVARARLEMMPSNIFPGLPAIYGATGHNTPDGPPGDRYPTPA